MFSPFARSEVCYGRSKGNGNGPLFFCVEQWRTVDRRRDDLTGCDTLPGAIHGSLQYVALCDDGADDVRLDAATPTQLVVWQKAERGEHQEQL